ITFSNSNPNSQFDFPSGGLNDSFSLFRGTSFPNVFAPDLDTFGAIAAETSMTFKGRVAPGVIVNPDTFWSDGLVGAVDLFTLSLTSDSSHKVSAVLSFGSATSNFTLDYANNAGTSFNPFDPTDPTLGSIKASIMSAFRLGRDANRGPVRFIHCRLC